MGITDDKAAKSRANVKKIVMDKKYSLDLGRAEAIHIYCIECVCYQPYEVRKCDNKGCALWRFRTGTYSEQDAKIQAGIE